MMRVYIVQKLINFFDYFQQKKVFSFLKNRINENSVIFDVGAHHGETIKNFIKNFVFSEIHSFEASYKNFDILKSNYNDKNECKIILNNFGLSNQKKEFKIHQFSESSSSTLSKINEKSKYFKRKINVLGLSKDKNYYENLKVQLDLLDNYFIEKKINKIDLLKIDTEGHEYYVLKGSIKSLPKIKYIYFEHHYDDMLKKEYTFSKIHDFLKQNGFKKIFKSKMFFRKTFEYIYENSKFN